MNQRTREIEGARDAAKAASEAKSLFLSNMSHEIRTPMNAILGFAQLLVRETGLTDGARNKVATILKKGEQLLGLINDTFEIVADRRRAGGVEARGGGFSGAARRDQPAV